MRFFILLFVIMPLPAMHLAVPDADPRTRARQITTDSRNTTPAHSPFNLSLLASKDCSIPTAELENLDRNSFIVGLEILLCKEAALFFDEIQNEYDGASLPEYLTTRIEIIEHQIQKLALIQKNENLPSRAKNQEKIKQLEMDEIFLKMDKRIAELSLIYCTSE